MQLITWILATLVSAFVGSYLASYLSQKGENRATHEDIDKLVDQVKAVTQATKQIETKLSSDLWDRQKRWELKREVLFEATKKLAEVEDALSAYDTMQRVECAEQKEDQAGWAGIKHERMMRWSKASSEFDEMRLFVRIVCGKDATEAFEALARLVNQIAAQAKTDPEIYRKSYPELIKTEWAVRAAVRKELGIEGSG
jgi:hypothetical protein